MTQRLQIIASSNFKKPLFSKWQKIHVLLDPIEMENLLEHLLPLAILNNSEVVPWGKIFLQIDAFMNTYQKYIDILQGKIPKQKIGLSYALSEQIDNFRAVTVAPDKYICRAVQPDVHMQAHEFLLDSGGQILPQVFSNEAISWGVQFSYPAIFQDSYTMEVFQTTRKPFSGWQLFSSIRGWIRNHSVPLPINFQGKIIHTPIRIGREAATWIANYIDREKLDVCGNTLSKICQVQTI